MLVGLIGGSIGWGLSVIIRIELGLPGFILCSSFSYNSVITFHGIFMIFFMIMPLLIGGFGNLIIPLMLCCSDMIFPRLNALSIWLLFNSLLLIYYSLFLNGGVNSGWTFYVPLSLINYYGIDLMFFSLHSIGLSSLLGSINFIISLLKACNLFILFVFLYLPLFCWSIFITSILLVISLPVLAACITMIIFDRHFNGCFFDIIRGGNIVFFQHLFWFFGHPEAYILIIPGFGLVSEILTKKLNKIIFARDSMLLSLLIIGVLGIIVWGHHMFIVGFNLNTKTYFTSATSIIAIPTAIKLLNWWATIWSSCLFWIVYLFFIIGFIFSFLLGGFTGLILANCIINTLLHDSYFVVSHFHYVLSLGAIYLFFSGFINYWGLCGQRIYNNIIGLIFFVVFFVASNLIFLFQHYLGMLNLPRRIFNYYCIYFLFNYLGFVGIFGILLSITVFYFALFNLCSF